MFCVLGTILQPDFHLIEVLEVLFRGCERLPREAADDSGAETVFRRSLHDAPPPPPREE